MVERREFLRFSLGSAVGLALGSGAQSAGEHTLRELAGAKNLLTGSAFSFAQMARPDMAELLIRECSMVICENELKWGQTQPERDGYNFAHADAMVAFARAHGQKLRGHNLCWHQSNPAWLEATLTPGNAAALLRRHIQVVAGRYRGKIHSWDVVNEAIHLEDRNAHGLRNSVWLKNLGAGYIELAFRAAAESDPGAILTYNDFGVEQDAPDQQRKRDAVLALLRDLRARGVPVQALGIQSHLTAHPDPPRFRELPGFLKELGKMGLQVFITELDVDDRDLPADIAKRDRMVADVYRDYLRTVLAQDHVRAVLTWGLADRDTWLDTYHPRGDGQKKRPLPFDAELRAKPAFSAMCEAIAECRARSDEKV
jgi:endo-1,4-beta-xylanase